MLNNGEEKIDGLVSPEQGQLEPGSSGVTVRSCWGVRGRVSVSAVASRAPSARRQLSRSCCGVVGV